jgi:hypothetical protein
VFFQKNTKSAAVEAKDQIVPLGNSAIRFL